MHIDEERLQLLLHGELSPLDEERVRSHLSGCDACSRRLAEMEHEEKRVGALLRELDHDAPLPDIGEIERRAGARSARVPRWAAAAALVLLVGGAAYALPGSPLPRWVGAIVEWAGGSRSSPSGDTSRLDDAGIAVAPGQDLVIVFQPPIANGQAVVTLTEGAEVELRAPRDAATFTSQEGRLLVEDRGPGATYRIGIPRTAPRVEIRVGDRRLFLKEGPRVTTAGSPQGPSGYLLPLYAPAP